MTWTKVRDCTNPDCPHYRIAGECRVERCSGCGREYHVLGASSRSDCLHCLLGAAS